GFARGIFPDIQEYYALIQSSSYDSLEPTISCPAATAIDAAYEGNDPAWLAHLTASSAVRAKFDNVSGIQPDDTAGWNTSWDHPYDNFSAKQCHQKPLPCSVNNTALCISQADANEVYRLGNYEYAYRWRGAENSTLYSALTMGPWMKELQGHIQDNIAGSSPIKYYHNFAHDGSIAPLLGLLQIDHPVWPGMGSEVVFELWKKSTTYYIRVLWSGQPLKTSTPLGTLDMIELNDFNARNVSFPPFSSPTRLEMPTAIHPPPQPITPQPDPSSVQAAEMSVILCTAGYDHSIRFWEAWSGICYRQIALQPQWKQVNRLAISPDKTFLAAAGNTLVRIWDIPSLNNAPVTSLEGHTANITALAYSAQGKWLVTGSEDGTVKVWDTRQVELVSFQRYRIISGLAPTSQVQRNYAHEAPVNDVVIHPNQGELISCDQAGSVKIWDLAENTCTHELVPDEDVAIRSVTIASDGATLVAGNDLGMCYVWKIQSASEPNTLQPVTSFQAHPKYITRCLLSPDTKHLATCSADTTIKLWSTSNYEYTLERTLAGHQRWVWDAAFSADSAYLVTASSDHAARLWDLTSGETVRQYDGHHR
ncbi:MAG: TOR complex subunit lst8, partial [Tremellales sp. Tagirdzhanova-0007]